MKKALHISIAETLFTIEEDAYAILDTYLSSIRTHFKAASGGDDIISDIENRIAEQFSEMGTKIITTKEVDSVIATMGKVEDFDPTKEHPGTTSADVRTNKKLYRDPSKQIIAGVCSGIAAYIGTDPLWIRIIFVLLTLFTQGIGIILYIILMIAIPKAATASQKLEMEGSPVTIDTISKNVKEKAEEIRKMHGSKIMHILSLPFAVLKKVVDFIIKYIAPIVRIIAGVIAAVAATAGMVALSVIAPLILTNGSTYVGFPLAETISPALFYFAIVSAYITLFIPCIVVFILAMSILRKKFLLGTVMGATLFILWCVAIASTVVAGFTIAEKVRTNPHVLALYETKTIEMALPVTIDTLEISDDIRVTYIQGSEASISLSGQAAGIESVSTSIDGQSLFIEHTPVQNSCLLCGQDEVEALVTVPNLKSVNIKEDSGFYADTWVSSTSVSISASQDSHMRVHIEAPEIVATAKQGSSIRLSGKTEHAVLNDVQGSYIDADELVVSTQMNQP